MKTTAIGVVLVFGVVGAFGGYLAPEYRQQRGYQGGNRNGGYGGSGGGGFGAVGGNGFGNGGGSRGAPEVLKFVTVHAPPNDFDEPKRFSGGPRVVYEKGPRDKNYNIIFVRAPTPPPHPRTQVILPKPNSQKTLVYVLVNKPEGPNGQNIKFKYPKPTKPTKPEVFFIPFSTDKGGKGGGQGQGGPGGITGSRGGYA